MKRFFYGVLAVGVLFDVFASAYWYLLVEDRKNQSEGVEPR